MPCARGGVSSHAALVRASYAGSHRLEEPEPRGAGGEFGQRAALAEGQRFASAVALAQFGCDDLAPIPLHGAVDQLESTDRDDVRRVDDDLDGVGPVRRCRSAAGGRC